MTPDHPRYKWWMVLTVVPAGLISAIDGTSVGIAIPSMMTSLRADLDQIQWVVTTYLLMQTLLMPMTGWLTALLGHRRLFVLSLLLFMLGTVLCSFAWSVESLMAFRVVQALGGGPLQPVSMALLYSAFPPHQRGTAVGLFNMSVAFGLIIGRLGGGLVETFDWRMIFYMTLPFGIVSAVLGWCLLPRTTPQRHWTLDPWGLLTLAGFLVPLLLACAQGRHQGWDSASIRTLVLLAALSLGDVYPRRVACAHPRGRPAAVPQPQFCPGLGGEFPRDGAVYEFDLLAQYLSPTRLSVYADAGGGADVSAGRALRPRVPEH